MELKIYVRSILVEDAERTHRDGRNPAPAFFYCSRNTAEPDRGDAKGILASIARQLSSPSREEPLLPPVTDLYEAMKGDNRPTHKGPTIDESCELIINCTRYYSATTILLDALDECNEETRGELLDSLIAILERSPGMVKVIVSSRREDDISEILGVFSSISISNKNSADIESFVRSEAQKLFQRRPFLRNSPSKTELMDLVIQKICNKAHGMQVS